MLSKSEILGTPTRKILHIKAIIDGKLYDTEKSEYIGLGIFKTAKGNYFTCDMSEHKYSERMTKIYLSDIKPLTENEVKNILGKTDVDKYIELFGEAEEA